MHWIKISGLYRICKLPPKVQISLTGWLWGLQANCSYLNVPHFGVIWSGSNYCSICKETDWETLFKSIAQWLLLREMWRIKKQLWKSENSARNSEEKPAIILSANLSPFVSVFKIKFFCNWVKARSSRLKI